MPFAVVNIAAASQQTATGPIGFGCAIDGGLGTITMTITTTSWTWGAAGVR